MAASRWQIPLFALCLAGMAWSGCSRGPEPVAQPDVDPARAAAEALERYDADRDGFLSAEELSASPGLTAARSSIDASGDGQISADELSNRIRLYVRRGAGVKSVLCVLTLDNQPLGGARVELIPEPFLGSEVLPAAGVSAEDGTVPLSVDSKALPDDLSGITAVHQGIYRVRVTHPAIQLPSQYNEETTLGCEVGPTTRKIAFGLSSR